jgi:replicative DNA helicase
LPNHFTDRQNSYVYLAIELLAQQGVENVDAYNIINALTSSENTRRYAEALTVEELDELIDMSSVIARKTVEEYRLLVFNVLDAALRRDVLQKLRECEALCGDQTQEEISQKIYSVLDDVLVEFSSVNDVPQFGEIVDDLWEQIKQRQGDGFSGVPFKFPALNQYVTIERGELIVFAAEAKQGKSMMLLNCAVDLMKQDKSVLYIDSELNSRAFTARLLSHLTKIEYRRLVSGSYDGDDEREIVEAVAWLKTRRFTHIYIPMFDQQSIYTIVKKVNHAQEGLDVLILDYFKSSADGDAFNSYQELGRLTDLVKNKICGDMGIAGIGAAQLTSAGKVADSAKIGRNASTVITILDKTQDEIETDGAGCGNKKLSVVLNRNGAQMTSGEYIDMEFLGGVCLWKQAEHQHIPDAPF